MLFDKHYNPEQLLKFLVEVEKAKSGIIDRLKRNKENFQDITYLTSLGVKTIGDTEIIREFLKQHYKNGQFTLATK